MIENITTFDLELLEPYSKIFCLVSGGIDSTFLYELIKSKYPEKIIPVNCFNPYENSSTLEQLRLEPRFLEIKPLSALDYKEILHQAFLRLPIAFQQRDLGKYTKKIFQCCQVIKHEAFLQSSLFIEPHSVVISGIKRGDGRQRGIWLKSLENRDTFFHLHKTKQFYCYPFRDYKMRELPVHTINQLMIKYPNLTHSGCKICPVLVLFSDRLNMQNSPNFRASLEYWEKIKLELKIE